MCDPRASLTCLTLVVGLLSWGSARALSQDAQAPDIEHPYLPETTVTADEPTGTADISDSYEPPSLYDFPFTSALADGYLADTTTTGSKIDVPVLDLPATVESITRSTIDDQQATKVDHLLRNVSGVYAGDTGGGQRDYMVIRGFPVAGDSSDYRKNGFRDVCRTQRDLANIERIEILKGPASVLYGISGQPYGVVNFITKKPLDYLYRSVEAQFGHWDNYRFTFDTTGPVDNSMNRFYRINLAAQHADSFRDFVDKDRFFISPVVTYRLDPDTQLTVELEWLHDNRTPELGIPYRSLTGSFQDVPVSRFLGQPDDNVRTDDGQVGLFLTRRAHGCLAWRAGYVSNWSEDSREAVMTKGSSWVDPLAQEWMRREVKDDHTVDSNHFFIGDLTSEFCTGPLIAHQLVFGTELGTNIRHKTEGRVSGTNINIFNPDYSQVQPVPTTDRFGYFQYDQYGIYLQDLISIGPRLKAMAGVRWDAYEGRYHDFRAGRTPTIWNGDSHSWNPRFGLVYQPVKDICSIYAGYATSFNPVVRSSTRLGDPFDPETGEMYEVGIKLDLLDGRLHLNIVGFDVFRGNMRVTDPIDPDYDIQVGEAESKGVEFDMIGRLTRRWSIITNCAFTDARISEDTEADSLGNRLPNVPYFGMSLWTRYDLIQRRDRTFGVATGVIYRGFRQGDVKNSYQLPGYARWDAGVYYRYGRLQLALVAENLLDEFYIDVGKNQIANIPGAPFNLMGSACLVY